LIPADDEGRLQEIIAYEAIMAAWISMLVRSVQVVLLVALVSACGPKGREGGPEADVAPGTDVLNNADGDAAAARDTAETDALDRDTMGPDAADADTAGPTRWALTARTAR